MNERRLQGLYSAEWGEGAQTPPPSAHSKARRLTPGRFVNDDMYSPASLGSDGDRHRLESAIGIAGICIEEPADAALRRRLRR